MVEPHKDLYKSPSIMSDLKLCVRLSCQDCDFSTRKETKLVKHVRKVHDKNVLNCPFCAARAEYFTSPAELSAHKKKEHKGARLRCFLCEFTSRSLIKWVKHCGGHQEMDIGCMVQLCLFQSGSTTKWVDHCNGHEDMDRDHLVSTIKEPYNLGVRYTKCNKNRRSPKKQFLDVDGIETKIMTHGQGTCNTEAKDSIYISSEDDDPTYISSEDEVLTFEDSKDEEVVHVRSDTGPVSCVSSEEDIIMCDEISSSDSLGSKAKSFGRKADKVCDTRAQNLTCEQELTEDELLFLKSKSDIELQVSKPETHLQVTEISEKQFICQVCEKKFKSKKYLASHLQWHTKVHKCTLCDKFYSTKYKLKIHCNSVHNERRILYPCKYCSLVYRSRYGLNSHVKAKHTMESKHVCSYCGHVSLCSSQLESHIRIHTGEKPFECHLCGYKTCLKRSLTVHMRSHTGERPHKCPFCDYAGAIRDNLEKHLRVHTGEKPFACDNCNVSFRQKVHLTNHRNSGICL